MLIENPKSFEGHFNTPRGMWLNTEMLYGNGIILLNKTIFNEGQVNVNFNRTQYIQFYKAIKIKIKS